MKRNFILWTVMGLMLSLPARAGEGTTPRTFDVWLKADVTIAADGTVESLAWKEDRPAAKLIIARIEPLVRRWEFLPGKIGGLPARTETHLSVRMSGAERDDGTVSLKVSEASTGAQSSFATPPRYPVNAVIDGVSAMLVAVVAIDANGVASVESMEFQGARGSSYRKEFIAAAEEAISAWTFRPERVAGRPVPAQIRVPIDFCVDRGCERLARAKAASDALAERGPPGLPVALDSVVQLVTQVRDQEI